MNGLLQRRRLLMQESAAAVDPYLLQPFTITFQTATKFAIYDYTGGIDNNTNPLSSLHIKINDGEWVQGTYNAGYGSWFFNNKDEVSINAGDRLQIKGVGTWAIDSSSYFNMELDSTSAKKCSLSGNVNSLVYGDNFVQATSMPDYGLCGVFFNGSSHFANVTDVSNLRLPATTVGMYAYNNMFRASTITNAPELPATELGERCYNNMFYNCTSLTVAPELPATTLASSCYASMFQGCTNLEQAPVLPATTMVTNCYRWMFRQCTKLTTAPVLPATTLASNCYTQMFYGCTRLNYIKAMFTTTPSTSYTNAWVTNVASSGTFVKNSAATWNVTGNNGVPSGWTIQTSNS